MKIQLLKFQFVFAFFLFISCGEKADKLTQPSSVSINQIHYATGFELLNFTGYSILKVTHPWPNSNDQFTYILKEKNSIIPDSLKEFMSITVPIKSIVVTSTTHIPALELLGVEKTLIGFPTTNYISSKKTRELVTQGKIRELGANENLTTEVLLDLAPDVLVGFGINNSNPTFENLKKAGIQLIYNGDWTEQSPLGRAEWIKFFGALYNKQEKANQIFSAIEKDYTVALKLVENIKNKPTVLCGSMYQNQWFVPQGDSWAALFLKEAQANYLWSNTKGIGSLPLSFEQVLEKAKEAQIWIAPGDFKSLTEMSNANPHYLQFNAFKNKKVYSYALNRGDTGGIIYFEWAATRPDWVLKDILKIVHPEVLPSYSPHFFQQLQD